MVSMLILYSTQALPKLNLQTVIFPVPRPVDWFRLLLHSSGWLTLTGCNQYGAAEGQNYPVTFVDVVGVNIQIDGVATPPVGADITPANFNMQTWASKKPNNWVSSVTPGIEDSYFQELHPITGDYGVQLSSVNIGQFALSYVMPAAVNDLPGYYWLAFDIRIVDPTNDTQCSDGFSFTYGYALDLYKPILAMWPFVMDRGGDLDIRDSPQRVGPGENAGLCAP